MTRWRLGTMGFGYPQRGGVFYPQGLKSSEYLAYYARHFDTVELDTTFHATPPVERVRRWAEATPPEFRFCAKAPRAVTHDQPIDRGVGAMMAFLNVMEAMYPEINHEQVDTTDRLEWWQSQVEQALAAGTIHTVWGFFNNDFAGYSVATCNRLKRMLGIEPPRPGVANGLFD